MRGIGNSRLIGKRFKIIFMNLAMEKTSGMMVTGTTTRDQACKWVQTVFEMNKLMQARRKTAKDVLFGEEGGNKLKEIELIM